jgi:hypothetical protein
MVDAEEPLVLIRPSLVSLAAGVLALAGCARSDAVGGAAGADGGQGGWGEGGWYDDGIADEAGPETGAGAGLSTGTGEDGDPVAGGGGAGGGVGPGCGDGTCQADVESCSTCPGDCGTCGAECGDGACQEAEGEGCDTCAEDCGSCPTCGDGVCSQPAEDCDVCFEDCGVCACEPDDLEPNGSSGAATLVAIGAEYADLSICAADVDWFEFPVNGTRTIAARFNVAEGDLDLEIYSGITGNYVTGSYSDDDDEEVVLSGVPSGTYWARVYGYQGDTNPDYALEVD